VFVVGGGGGGGVWARALEGRVISRLFTIWGGSNLFIHNRGRVTVFFGKEKITPCRLVDSYFLRNTRSV